MSRQYSHDKRDTNEPQLREALLRLIPDAVIVTMRPGQGYDWTVITRYGVLIVENKRPGEGLTTKEREFRDKVLAAGGNYLVWYNAACVEQDVKDYLLPSNDERYLR